MVRARNRSTAIALQSAAKLDAAVRAAVVQHVNGLVSVANHKHWLASNAHGVVVARAGDLRFMTAIYPDFFEYLVDFLIKYSLVGIHTTVDAVRLYELVEIDRHGRLGSGR
jgi:hypothetical protein